MLEQSVAVSLDTSLTSSSLGDTSMLSQKAEKDYLPDSYFGRSFALSLVAIAMLTLALPLLTATSTVVPDNVSDSNAPVRSVTK
jgi:hypothetical protein